MANQTKTLVTAAMKEKELSNNDVVRSIGYKNVNKGVRRFFEFLDEGKDDKLSLFNKNLANTLGIDQAILDQALQQDVETRKQQFEAAEREQFKPFVYFNTKATRPTQICIFAMTGGVQTHKMFFVPEDLPSRSWDFQKQAIKELSAAHFQTKKGIVPFFGAITGYTYCPTYDSSYVFDLEGITDSENLGHLNLPMATVRI